MLINNTLDGYLKDIEIKGNTWQDSENLADIRSVGTKVEGQELYEIPVLSCGKNLFNGEFVQGSLMDSSGEVGTNLTGVSSKDFIKINNTSINYMWETPIATLMKIYCYKSNYEYISSHTYTSTLTTNGVGKLSLPSETYYIKFRLHSTNNITPIDDITVQIEEGTQATPYEPYQEDKLTILSPTPLEKVGDIADRIVCKDGVWGVEKNIGTCNSDNLKINNYKYISKNNIGQVGITISDKKKNNKLISSINIIPWQNSWDTTETALSMDGEYNIYTYILGATDIDKCKDYLNSSIIKYHTTQPTFIPLPHDQQIKLRTFADRTHIHFETEIEGTIKAQVPKSLGATVNSHTTQIDNLNKELDRVKKLEESTVSTVTSDKAFTTIAETSGGYFEDVKIEGKTLVNLVQNKNKSIGLMYSDIIIPSSKIFTMYISTQLDATHIKGALYRTIDGNVKYFLGYSKNVINKPVLIDINNDIEGAIDYRVYIQQHDGTQYIDFNEEDFNILVLEGDHTDKDISYFEGLKSVGQDTDKIVVSSVNENLFDKELAYSNIKKNDIDNTVFRYNEGNRDIIKFKQNDIRLFIGDKFEKNTQYSLKLTGRMLSSLNVSFSIVYTDNTSTSVRIGTSEFSSVWVTSESGKTISFIRSLYTDGSYSEVDLNDIVLVKGVVQNNAPHKSNKKEILYFNPTTQTWEKPILRQWDSIEKHGDGKYYYHKRSEEVVLNGSESWDAFNVKDGYIWAYSSKILPTHCKLNGNYVFDTCISDRLNTYYGYGHISDNYLGNSVALNERYLKIALSDSVLPSVDKEGIAKWLQANPVTVVYQLAKEEVYECTNLDLITYSGKTNLIVNSGVIQPKLELKVHSNISNIVKLLQEKVSILESDINKYMISQNRSQLDATYKSDSVTFKIDYVNSSKNMTNDYSEDLYNLILDNILVGKDNYNYNHMFNLIMDYASWNKITWEQFDELVLLMDLQHNPIEELPEELN